MYNQFFNTSNYIIFNIIIFSIGMQLRKIKNIYKKDANANIIQPPKHLADYIQYFKSKGLKFINLGFAKFFTKNGLSYNGMVATKKIGQKQVFITIPDDCILNSKKAYQSGIKSIFDQNLTFFSKQSNQSEWQERILLVFLLYEYAKGSKSQWYHLINNMPRQIDLLIFWQQKQIKLLEDPNLEKIIAFKKQKYENMKNQLINILKKYNPPDQIIKDQNIQWLYSNVISRDFGDFIYSSLVPFIELLNHECVDVTLDLTHKSQQEPIKEKKIYNQEILYSSDQSNYSESQYQFVQIDINYFDLNKTEIEIKFDDNIVKQFNETEQEMIKSIDFGDSISLGYLIITFEEINNLKFGKNLNKQFILKQISKIKIRNQTYIKLIDSFFSQKNIQYSELVKKQDKNKKKNTSKIQNQQIKYKKLQQQFIHQEYKRCYVKCDKYASFQQGAQVYFCYGRNSNRDLLLRYGFALEYNKYNYIFIQIDMKKLMNYKTYPEILQIYKISPIIKMKLKRRKLCGQLIVMLRAAKWNSKSSIQSIFQPRVVTQQIQIINQAINIFKDQLKKYTQSVQELQKSLCDKSLNYHQYYSIVYKLQNQRIIHFQLTLFKIIKQSLKRIKQKWTMQRLSQIIPELQTEQEIEFNRNLIGDYLDRTKFT